jgi:penicillin-binding protein 1C
MLLAASDPSIQTQYWYINDKFYSKTKPGRKIFFKPNDGRIKITCLDDLGRKTTIQTKITYY